MSLWVWLFSAFSMGVLLGAIGMAVVDNYAKNYGEAGGPPWERAKR